MPGVIHLNLQPKNLVDQDTASKLIVGEEVAFEVFFKSYFLSLHRYASAIVKDVSAAEEIVQNVFFKLWERKDTIAISQSTGGYLYKSVYNESINYLKHVKVKARYHTHVVAANKDYEAATDPAAVRELQQKIEIAFNELPEQCRTTFQLSRYDGLKYQNIAAQMGISVKTVESHMGKALRLLRQKLAEFLPVLFIVFINLQNLML